MHILYGIVMPLPGQAYHAILSHVYVLTALFSFWLKATEVEIIASVRSIWLRKDFTFFIKKAQNILCSSFTCLLFVGVTCYSSLSCVNLDKQDVENGSSDHVVRRTYSTSAPATTNCLLGNFEVQMHYDI